MAPFRFGAERVRRPADGCNFEPSGSLGLEMRSQSEKPLTKACNPPPEQENKVSRSDLGATRDEVGVAVDGLIMRLNRDDDTVAGITIIDFY